MDRVTLEGRQVFLPIALELLAIGLCPVLLHPGDKRPVFHDFNRWQIGQLSSLDLQTPEDKRPLYYSEHVLRKWAEAYPNANVGVLTREAPTIDVDNEQVWEILRNIIPTTPHIKTGARGWSFIYSNSALDPVQRTRVFQNEGQVHVEILANGRQTVLPPSIHPDTGRPYEWVGNSIPLCTTPAPQLTQTVVNEIELALRMAGLLKAKITGAKAHDDGAFLGNEDRYAKFFRIRLDDKFALVTQAAPGTRQQALNDAVVSCSPAVRVGALSQDDLYAAMHNACMQNGYIQQDGERAFVRQFFKALEEGSEIAELPDLGQRLPGSSQTAAEVFAGHRPLMPGVPTPQVSAVPPVTPLPGLVRVSDLAKRQAPARQWTVEGWVPHRQVSLLYGEGGIGKSTLLMQMAIAIASGRPFLGTLPTVKRKVLMISAEDEIDEVHYRVHEMAKAFAIPEGDFQVLSLADLESAVLWTPAEGLTTLFHYICELVSAEGFGVVIMDPVADLFGGLDIDKQQVNRFMRALRKRLCLDLGASVIIAAHPSSDGMRSGRGTAGTVAWSNSARSRMYFERLKDSDVLELCLKKANRAALGKPIGMRWVNGVFIKAEPRSEDGTEADKVKLVFDELERRNFSYKKAHTAGDWVGIMMDPILGLDRNDRTAKRKLVDLITAWERAGYIKFSYRTDDHKNKVPFIEYVKHPPSSSA